ncbi:M20/M25/M40 family metallo-hydrolase [Ravibacter arvi]|uniref:M20/M25/M40 family metallo-hydrolase n=1 Tax=Ravibacter arvi TaxID=2051041 RepID=A0ABP8MA15_9BACT
MKHTAVFLFLLWSLTTSYSQVITPSSLQTHINVLASDSLEGRGTATTGEIKAANYIARQFQKAGLMPRGHNDTYFQPFTLSFKIDGFTHQQTARNVVGLLDNGAAATIVIGAHYDHLGTGLQSGSLAPESAGYIHNGADDNASGTAGMIELAHFLASNNIRERFNFLFIAFSAEELGLIGSKYFVENPTIPFDDIAFMINMDMIGRYNAGKGLTIGGWGTSSWWGKLIPGIARQQGIVYKPDSSGIGPSDHTSFYSKKKPVLFFFTGAHSDYHKPVDDADKINAEGTAKVLAIITGLIAKLDSETGIPDYLEAANPHAQASRTSFKVTLGVMPDYNFTGNGVRIDGVSAGRPAELAGIKSGDVITRIGKTAIKDIYEYMDVLGKHEKGQTVEVEFVRGQEIRKTRLTF